MFTVNNFNEKVLPLTDPPITSYPFHANLLSVIMNHDETLPWIYNNYIQLETPKISSDSYGKYPGVRLDFYSPLLWKTCPWVYYQRLSRSLVSSMSNSIVNFFIKCIDMGYYIYAILNQFYITASSDFQTRHRNHDTFIFGYNLKDEEFYLSDFHLNGKYAKSKARFAFVEKAYETIDVERDLIGGIELINFREKRLEHPKFKFDVSLVNDLLIDYLNSNDSAKRYRIATEQHKENWAWGIEVYKVLIEFIDRVIANEFSFMDNRPFHVLLDHKRMMALRIMFMGNNGYLNNYKTFFEEFKDIEGKVEINRNLLIKYFIKKDAEILNKMKNIIIEVSEKEKEIILTILQNVNF